MSVHAWDLMSESKKPVMDSSHDAAAPAAEASKASSAKVVGRIGEVAASTAEGVKNKISSNFPRPPVWMIMSS
jgi:hypothetical protein